MKRVVETKMSEQPWQSAVIVSVIVFTVVVLVGPIQPHELLIKVVVVDPSLLEQTCAELFVRMMSICVCACVLKVKIYEGF